MEFLKEHLGEELYNQVTEALKDKSVKIADLASGEYVAKGKYEAELSKNKAAQATLKELQERVTSFDGIDIEGLKKQATEWEEKYNADLAKQRLDYEVEKALLHSKPKNSKAVKSLLDFESIKLDGDNVTGIAEQLEALKKSDAYLFEEVGSTGLKHDTPARGGLTKDMIATMSAKEINNRWSEVQNALNGK